MKLSVIIPHLRGAEILKAVLDDLEQELAGWRELAEVIVVDNASTDGSVEEAKLAHPWIEVLRLAKNEGYAGGCNHGIRAGRGEWVLLLNDDVRIHAGALQALVARGESEPDIAAVQPKILSQMEPERFDYAGAAGGLIDMFGYPFALGRIGGKMETDHAQYDSPREIFWSSGTGCLWRRETLQQIGLLDSTFFAHMEEIDLAWRAHLIGQRIVSEPAAVLQHLGGGTLAYQAWRKMYLNHRNNLIMILKNLQTIHLLWMLPFRWAMDIMIGLQETLLRRPGRLVAILAGWGAALMMTPKWWGRRRRIQRLRTVTDGELRGGIFRGSILFAYAIGLRRASSVAKWIY
ncbi:glycosyltransferase [bacterium]|nr:glycosyltransferase [bacterium]